MPTLASLVASGSTSISSDLFHIQVPPTEKALRTVFVYLGLALLIRLVGKRQLAQLNTFDLVVVLLLSNVVQNAVIGQDSSLVGGLLGAAVLVGFDAVMNRVALLGPRTAWLLQGSPTVLVRHGVVDEGALRRLGLQRSEMEQALRLQGAASTDDVSEAALQPGGTFSVKIERDDQSASVADLRQAMADLQRHIDERLSGFERRDPGALGGQPVTG